MLIAFRNDVDIGCSFKCINGFGKYNPVVSNNPLQNFFWRCHIISFWKKMVLGFSFNPIRAGGGGHI